MQEIQFKDSFLQKHNETKGSRQISRASIIIFLFQHTKIQKENMFRLKHCKHTSVKILKRFTESSVYLTISKIYNAYKLVYFTFSFS